MYLKKLNAEIPQETESQVIQHIKEARTLLPFLVDLPIDERIRMVKLSRKFVDFVDRALLHASANPRFFPAYLSSEEFAGNVALKSCLQRIYAEVNCLYERLKDTIMLVESEIYATSRVKPAVTRPTSNRRSEPFHPPGSIIGARGSPPPARRYPTDPPGSSITPLSTGITPLGSDITPIGHRYHPFELRYYPHRAPISPLRAPISPP